MLATTPHDTALHHRRAYRQGSSWPTLSLVAFQCQDDAAAARARSPSSVRHLLDLLRRDSGDDPLHGTTPQQLTKLPPRARLEARRRAARATATKQPLPPPPPSVSRNSTTSSSVAAGQRRRQRSLRPTSSATPAVKPMRSARQSSTSTGQLSPLSPQATSPDKQSRGEVHEALFEALLDTPTPSRVLKCPRPPSTRSRGSATDPLVPLLRSMIPTPPATAVDAVRSRESRVLFGGEGRMSPSYGTTTLPSMSSVSLENDRRSSSWQYQPVAEQQLLDAATPLNRQGPPSPTSAAQEPTPVPPYGDANTDADALRQTIVALFEEEHRRFLTGSPEEEPLAATRAHHRALQTPTKGLKELLVSSDSDEGALQPRSRTHSRGSGGDSSHRAVERVTYHNYYWSVARRSKPKAPPQFNWDEYLQFCARIRAAYGSPPSPAVVSAADAAGDSDDEVQSPVETPFTGRGSNSGVACDPKELVEPPTPVTASSMPLP